MNITRPLGWFPDLPDKRDYPFTVGQIEAPPTFVDLRSKCSPIENQGRLGSCTAHALVGAMEFLEHKEGKAKVANLSRLFVYYNERLAQNTIDYDSGSTLRTGIKTLSKLGVCHEALWPYRIGEFAAKPSEDSYSAAEQHKIGSYYRITKIADMFAALANGLPFVFGFSVYDSLMTPEVDATGDIPIPEMGETMLGGHAILAVGYDVPNRVFFIRNSWGVEWGKKGYGTIPFDYLSDRNLASDFWVINLFK